MAYDYLEDHALRNVWCAPYQDREAIVQLARVTPPGGVWNQVRIGWRTHTLPKAATRTHVYVVGQLHPLILGLAAKPGEWRSLTQACNDLPLICDLYVQSGVQLPRFEAWVTVDADRQVIVAVLDPKPLIAIELGTEPLFLRVYTNAYYQSLRADPRIDHVTTDGARPKSTDAILKLQTAFAKLQALPGAAYAFVNGYKVSTIDLFTVKAGDAVEYIYDASVFKIVDFKIQDLRTFDSLLDNKTKYLLHYAGLGDNEIDYQDDVDVFLLHPEIGGRQRGVYVHRNAGDTLRMVTHKDYALVVQYLTALQRYQPDWTDTNALTVRLHIRYGGWNRALVNENNRIKELYKLPDSDLRGALLGIDSSVENWRADVLENSAYTAIMRQPTAALTKTMVEAAYGYNAISKLLADTPTFTRDASGQPVIDVPYGLQSRAVGYEYDAKGWLLGYYSHSSGGSVYAARDSRARLIEMTAGVGDTQLDEVYGQRSTELDPSTDYRMYVCDLVNGVPDNKWRDVTDTSAYGVIDGTLTWAVDFSTQYTLVRGNRNFLAYTQEFAPTQINGGVLRFSLLSRQRHGDTIGMYVMSLPMGELDLWLNGRSLVPGVDYVLRFPEVMLISKEYLNDPLNKSQRIDVRFSGHCQPDQALQDTEQDQGWVQDQLLSVNGRFNIRDDKVLRIVANGALYDRSELKFSETDAGVAVLDPINGRPYLVRDIVVPMRGQTLSDTYSMRASSKAIDERISAYLSLKIPEAPIPAPSVVPSLYRLYSPFCAKLIYDMNSGLLDDPRLYQQYSTSLVLELCKPYEWLLAFDPTQEAQAVDPRFTIIHPHNLDTVIDIGIYQHKFLTMAVKQYLNNKVNLSGHLRIKDYITES